MGGRQRQTGTGLPRDETQAWPLVGAFSRRRWGAWWEAPPCGSGGGPGGRAGLGRAGLQDAASPAVRTGPFPENDTVLAEGQTRRVLGHRSLHLK